MNVAEDLDWLEAEAFEFTLSFNDHRPSFETVEQYMGGSESDDWISPEAKAEAIAANRMVRAQVYPCGSVGSYSVAGTEIGAVVARARELCAAELERWKANGLVPLQNRHA